MKNIVLIIILCAFVGLLSCDRSESIDGMFEHAEEIMPQYPDSVLTLLSGIEKVNDLSESEQAMYYLLLTEAEDKMYIKHTSDSLIEISTNFFSNHDNINLKAKSWYYRGRVNQDLGDALHAQDCYLKALHDDAHLKDYALLGRINNKIGALYAYQDVYEKALSYQEKASFYFSLINDSIGQSFALRDISRMYRAIGKKDSSIIYSKRALPLSNDKSRASICSELGSLYVDIGDYAQAFEYLRSSLSNSTDEKMLAPTFLTLGRLYSCLHQKDSAYHYLNLAKLSHNQLTKAGGYYQLAQLEKENENWKGYAGYQMKYEELRDSLSLLEQTESIRKVESLYNYHNTESKLLQATIALDRMEYNSTRNKLIALCAVLGLFIVLIITYIEIKAKKKRIEEQRQRLSALGKKQEEAESLINKNEKNIIQLKDLLEKSSVAFDEREKELIALRKLRLEHENEKLRCIKSENELLVQKFHMSDIYYRFHVRGDWKPKEDDWDQLFKALDETYDNFTRRLLGVTTKLTAMERRVCCLVKMNVAPTTIAVLLFTTPTNVSMVRKRLFEKIYPDSKGSSEMFDKFIHDF